MNINFIQNYADEYFFDGNNEDGVAAFQLNLDDSFDKNKQITQFFDTLKIDVEHLYLLIYASNGPFYNKLAERKKIWGLYSDMTFPMVGDTHTYAFPAGIVFASYVRLDEKSLENGIELLVKNHLQSSMIYSPNVPLKNEKVGRFFKRMFDTALQDNTSNPSGIFMNYNALISHFCDNKMGVIRYGTDGCCSEICCFTRNNLLTP